MSKVIHMAARLRGVRLLVAVVIMLGMVLGSALTPTKSYAAPVPGAEFCDLTSPPESDAVTLVCMPPLAPWNNSLVVYAHGYLDPLAPLGLPAELELFNADGTLNMSSTPALLLAQGYAVATTSYTKNGYDVEAGAKSIDALVSKFQRTVGRRNLKKVYLIGASQGALISVMLAERDPRTYNGGVVALCGPLAGWSYEVNYFGDFGVVFNYFFHDTALAMAAAPDDATRAGLLAAAFSDPANAQALQQLFSVTGAAVDPTDPTSSLNTALQVLYYGSPTVQADLLATAGGNPYGNLRTRYTGSFDNKALNKGVLRIAADRRAERYVDRYYTPDGDSRAPIVTLHNLYDPVVPYANELIFAREMRQEHNLRRLTALTSDSYGHCNFTQGEILNAFATLVTPAPAH